MPRFRDQQRQVANRAARAMRETLSRDESCLWFTGRITLTDEFRMQED